MGLLVALGLDELARLGVPYKVVGWALAGLGLASLFPATGFPAAGSPLYTAFDTGLACPSACLLYTSITRRDRPITSWASTYLPSLPFS